MNLNDCYLEEDLFPKKMTSYEERPYGILFYNTNNKGSFDSNHAVIYKDKIQDLHAVLKDIKDFYREKGTNAIIYQSMLDDKYFEEIKEDLTSEGYRSWSEEQRYMLPLAENKIVPSKELVVKQFNEWNDSFTQIFLEAEEPWEIDVTKDSMKNDNAWAFVAYLGDKPVGILYGHLTEKVCRGDYLLVSKKHRGIGAGRAIFDAYVKWCNKTGITNCYLWPNGEIAGRIYYEAGYRLVEVRTAGRAVYDIQ